MATSETSVQRLDEMAPFLRRIAEEPDADLPRLVFADWLDEHDDPDRAKFIRLQIELARMDPADDGYAEKTAAMRRCAVFTEPGELPFFDHLPTKKCRIGFRRGFIEAIDTADADGIDTSGFDLVPLLALRSSGELIDQFKGFTKLRWLEYRSERDTPSVRLLEILGSKGWFKNLEELSLPYLNKACLEAGVVPQFDLPRLRNFFVSTDAFYNLGAPPRSDDDDDSFYIEPRPWDGLPDYLPRNTLPSPKSPLERFVWHSHDDCDYFSEEDWYWRGPAMESLLGHLKGRDLKQVEIAVDYDDHEGGSEGVITAPFQQNPFELCPTLDHVTLDEGDLWLLEGSTHKLKALRVYGYGGFEEALFGLLKQPECSELESLHIEARGGWWGRELTDGPSLSYLKLKSLHLEWMPWRLFTNCQFPSLISFRGGELKTLLERTWLTLQKLHVSLRAENLADLKAFAASDCCPNLTTLTIDGYYEPGKTDFSFLAQCPHMPFLSLIQFPDYPMSVTWIVDAGELIPVRGDVMVDDLTPTTGYRLHVVF